MSSKHAVFSTYGKILGTALSGSFQTAFTATEDVFILHLLNSCNQPIIVSLDGGTTSHFELDGEGVVIDLRSSEFQLGKPVVQVKHAGVAPTSGSLRVTGGYV